jgi:hypothetical protein
LANGVIGKVERVDFIIRKNATFKMTFNYNDPSTGAAIPITGWDVDMEFRDAPGGNLLASFSVGDGFTIDGPNGRVDFKVQPSEIATWTFNSGWYDIRMTDTIGDKDVWAEGKFEVKPGVTDS